LAPGRDSRRSRKHAEFEEKCFAVATRVLGDNPHAWLGLGLAAAKSADRRVAFQKVIAIASDPANAFVHDPGGTPQYNARKRSEHLTLLALKERAETELHSG
jgi:hypothetical protein